jgi:hypothetical protein
VRWGYRCRVVCPLGARAVFGPRARRPVFRVPWVRPSSSTPSPRVTGHRGGCFSSRALHVVPDSERVLRAVFDDSLVVDSPLPSPSSDWAPALTSPGLQAYGLSRCDPGPGGLFRGGPITAVMRVGEWVH